jgi:CRISPR-associated protein Csm5
MSNYNRFYIRILSPLHIGCDEVYEPMGFVVDESTCELVSFDPFDFFRELPPLEKTKLADICRKGTISSLLELNKFMQSKKAHGYRIKLCHGFLEHYKQNISMKPSNEFKIQQELNRFSIFRTAFHEHTNLPYIPGSSIKGALRTAYLNALAMKNKDVHYDNPKKNKYAAQQLEKGLLNYTSLEKDPFRLLRVSDFVPVQAETKIVYAVNEKKQPSKSPARGPYQILEVIEPGAVFIGTIATEDRYTKEADIKRPLTMDALLNSSLLFYGNEKQREDSELNAAGLPFLKAGKPDRAVPIRIGRHSGAESVTIDGHRDIRIMGNRGQSSFSKRGATTFWLASEVQKSWKREQLQPFGWAILGAITEEMYRSYEKTIQENRQRLQTAIQDNLVDAKSDSVRLSARTAESKTISVLSPLEKLLSELKMINANDAGRIGTLIQKIEQLETVEDKAAMAAAIRSKLGEKAFKKHKRKDYLQSLLQES